MNSKEMWNMLENMETKDIRILVDMCIRYLEMDRNVNFKDIIKDINTIHNFLESHI